MLVGLGGPLEPEIPHEVSGAISRAAGAEKPGPHYLGVVRVNKFGDEDFEGEPGERRRRVSNRLVEGVADLDLCG